MSLTTKTELRSQMKRQRAGLTPAQRQQQNAAIAARVLAEPAFVRAKTVFCYCSTAEEIDTRPILRAALEMGKRLCVPRTKGKGEMDACCIDSLSRLRPAAYGIEEPDAGCPVLPPAQIDLCIIPCLAADRHGFRLGYGGGYYDRFLPQTTALRLVLCAQERLLPRIPSQEHDIACDIILTESQVIRFHEK